MQQQSDTSGPIGIADYEGGRLARTELPLIGMIRNPISHRNKGAEVNHAGLDPDMIANPRSREEIETALHHFATRGVGLLMIDGGDGTVRDVLTRGAAIYGDNWPQLMILPKGKTNALAMDLGAPKKWSLPDALVAARSGRIVRRFPLILEREGDHRPERWGFIFGAGVFNTAIELGQVAHRYGAFQGFAVGLTGAAGAVQALLGTSGSRWRRTSPIRIYAGDKRREIPYAGDGDDGCRYLVLLSTLRNLPLGMKPFRQTDHGIRYLVFDTPLRRLMLRFGQVVFGRDDGVTHQMGVHRGAATEFSMTLDEGFIFDGEAYPSGHIRIRLGPALDFIVP